MFSFRMSSVLYSDPVFGSFEWDLPSCFNEHVIISIKVRSVLWYLNVLNVSWYVAYTLIVHFKSIIVVLFCSAFVYLCDYLTHILFKEAISGWALSLGFQSSVLKDASKYSTAAVLYVNVGDTISCHVIRTFCRITFIEAYMLTRNKLRHCYFQMRLLTFLLLLWITSVIKIYPHGYYKIKI